MLIFSNSLVIGDIEVQTKMSAKTFSSRPILGDTSMNPDYKKFTILHLNKVINP